MNKRMHQSWRREKLMNDPFIRKRLEYTSDKASDYSTVFLPWGPNWNAKKIRIVLPLRSSPRQADAHQGHCPEC